MKKIKKSKKPFVPDYPGKDIDDLAAPLLFHYSRRRLCKEEHRSQVYLQYVVPIGFAELERGRAPDRLEQGTAPHTVPAGIRRNRELSWAPR